MNIELKPIAESKIRQLGGDVCGVLVRKDGKLVAVDEHGRVQWLRKSEEAEEAEAKGRVLMDMCRDLRARVTELEDALVWALGKLSIEVPVTGGNVSYIRAFEKADKALSSGGRAYLLRKQADEAERAGGGK